MKHLLRILLISSCFLATISLKAQKNKINPNGYNTFYYGNGQLSSEGNMRNGKPDGYWKTYHVNGNLKSEGKRKMFQLDSIWNFYDETGALTEKITYLQGSKNGYSYRYASFEGRKEVLIAKELYVNNMKQGKAYYYFPDGKLKQEIPFLENKKHGNGIEYDENGNIITLYVYHNDYILEKEKINRRDEQGKKQGVWKEFFGNGNVAFETEYKDGKVHGYVKKYKENGQLIEMTRYEKGTPVAIKDKKNIVQQIDIQITRYPSGKLKTRGSFIKNVPIGIHRTYNEAGEVIGAKIYDEKGVLVGEGIVDKKGEKQGQWKYFYEDKSLKAKGEYRNDERQGKWTFYFQNGKIEQKGNYENGKFKGEWIWFYKNGDILRRETYIDGRKDGISEEFDETGKTILKGKYVDGFKHGAWFFDIGDEKQEGTFKNDLKTDKWKTYFANGKVKEVGEYIQGFPHGKHKLYHENGKIKEEGVYVMGKKHKNWRTFDDKGNVLITITYRNGLEVKIDGVKIKR